MSRIVVYERKTPATGQYSVSSVDKSGTFDADKYRQENGAPATDVRVTVLDITPDGDVVKVKTVTLFASS